MFSLRAVLFFCYSLVSAGFFFSFLNDMLCMWMFVIVLYFLQHFLDRFALNIHETLQLRVHMAKNVLPLLRACRKLDLAVFFYSCRSLVIFIYRCFRLLVALSGEDFNAFIIGCVYGFLVCVFHKTIKQ